MSDLPGFIDAGTQAEFRVLQGIGHLSPLQAPDALADVCKRLLHVLSRPNSSRI
jgi:hypothetical protein